MSEGLLKRISDAAKAKFQDIPFPSRKDEYWRFADLEAWSVDSLLPYFAGRPTEEGCNGEFEDLEFDEGGGGGFATLFDGQLVDADVPRGAEIYSAGAAAEKFPEAVEKFHSMRGGKFDALNSTRPDAGILIRVGDGESAELNLKIISKLPVSIAGVCVLLGRGSRLALRKTNLAFGGSFSALKCGYFLAEGSKLELASLKYSSKYALCYEREDFDLGAGADVADAVALAAEGHSRQERNFALAQNARADSRIFALAESDAVRDIRTSQIHAEPGAQSNVEVRAALGGLAGLAFTGLIRVGERAVKTRSYQSCRSLMLSDTAKSQASPILEISCNDVACSHGCTVSKPSGEQMFYMMQRGLGLGDAESLIVRGFAETSFERISDRELVEKWLGRLFA